LLLISRLDVLSVEYLIKEARSYGLMPQARSREHLIDQIMFHLERYGPCNDFVHTTAASQSTPGSSETSTSRINHPPDDTNDSRTYLSAPDPPMSQIKVWPFRRHDKAAEWIDLSGHAIDLVSSTKTTQFLKLQVRQAILLVILPVKPGSFFSSCSSGSQSFNLSATNLFWIRRKGYWFVDWQDRTCFTDSWSFWQGNTLSGLQ